MNDYLKKVSNTLYATRDYLIVITDLTLLKNICFGNPDIPLSIDLFQKNLWRYFENTILAEPAIPNFCMMVMRVFTKKKNK